MKIQYLKNIYRQSYFFIPNIKLESFQLSFDILVVHTNQQFWFFQNRSTKIWKIFSVRLIDFSLFYKKNYSWLDVFQRLYRWIKMPAFIWDLSYLIWIKFGDMLAKFVILIPPHLIDWPKSPPWLGLISKSIRIFSEYIRIFPYISNFFGTCLIFRIFLNI